MIVQKGILELPEESFIIEASHSENLATGEPAENQEKRAPHPQVPKKWLNIKFNIIP